MLEDDVILAPDFADGVAAAVRASQDVKTGILIFLGGADTKVPKDFFQADNPLYPLHLPTTEGYITDAVAIRKRLTWLESNKIGLPSDHLMKQIDRDCKITQYWVRDPLVEQVSVTGLFTSKLDSNRLKHSAFYNAARHNWNKFQRRKLRTWMARIRAVFS